MGGISSDSIVYFFYEASGSLGERVRQSVVNLIRGSVVKRGVAALMVVEANPLGESLAQV